MLDTSMEMTLAGISFAGLGILMIVLTILDWDYLMNHPKSRVVTALVGRSGTRVLYALIGLIIVGAGIAIAAGLVGPPEVAGP
jgi:hypothetical protein